MSLDNFLVENDRHCLCSDVDRGTDIFMSGLGRHRKTLPEDFETQIAADETDEAHAALGRLIKRHRGRCRPAWKAKLNCGLRKSIIRRTASDLLVSPRGVVAAFDLKRLAPNDVERRHLDAAGEKAGSRNVELFDHPISPPPPGRKEKKAPNPPPNKTPP